MQVKPLRYVVPYFWPFWTKQSWPRPTVVNLVIGIVPFLISLSKTNSRIHDFQRSQISLNETELNSRIFILKWFPTEPQRDTTYLSHCMIKQTILWKMVQNVQKVWLESYNRIYSRICWTDMHSQTRFRNNKWPNRNRITLSEWNIAIYYREILHPGVLSHLNYKFSSSFWLAHSIIQSVWIRKP